MERDKQGTDWQAPGATAAQGTAPGHSLRQLLLKAHPEQVLIRLTLDKIHDECSGDRLPLWEDEGDELAGDPSTARCWTRSLNASTPTSQCTH